MFKYFNPLRRVQNSIRGQKSYKSIFLFDFNDQTFWLRQKHLESNQIPFREHPIAIENGFLATS